MKIYYETSIEDFEAWSGGEETLQTIIENDKIDEFENMIKELYPEEIEKTELNDFLWFESDYIFEYLGIEE